MPTSVYISAVEFFPGRLFPAKRFCIEFSNALPPLWFLQREALTQSQIAMTIAAARFIDALLRRQATRNSFFSFSQSFLSLRRSNSPVIALSRFLTFQNPCISPIASPLEAPFASFYCTSLRFFVTSSSSSDDDQLLG